eukprot:6210848-Pleurochrysis_carterae.AAC.2
MDIADDAMQGAGAALMEPTICLAFLSEDLTMEVLKFLSAYDLGRLTCVSRKFASVFIAVADGSELTLPEMSAKARFEDAVEKGGAWAYERAVGESYKQVLLLLESGLLKPGVLHSVPCHRVCLATGWIPAYVRPYSHRTADADLLAIPHYARYVLFAACESAEQSLEDAMSGNAVGGKDAEFAILAWGCRDKVLQVTHDCHGFRGGVTRSENEENGVHWYLWPEHAIGFSSDPNLFLYYADAAISIMGEAEIASEDRLSWNLETTSTGGYRAGRHIDLGASSEWLKCLYYRM